VRVVMLDLTCCKMFCFVRRMHEWKEFNVLEKCSCLTPCADMGIPWQGSATAAVDIFNATSGTWSTAVLSAARYVLAATSLPNLGVAIFAGGQGV